MSSPPTPSLVVSEASTHSPFIQGKRILRASASSFVRDDRQNQDFKPPEAKRLRCGMLVNPGFDKGQMDDSEGCDKDRMEISEDGGGKKDIEEEEEEMSENVGHPQSCESSGKDADGMECPQNTASNFTSPIAAHFGGSIRMSSPLLFSSSSGTKMPVAVYKNGRNVAANGARKLVIRNFKQRSTPSETNVFDESWRILEEAVVAIQKKRKVSTSLEQLYQTVENLCGRKLSMNMYNELQACIVAHVKDELNILLGNCDVTVLFLRRLNALWFEFCQQMVMIRSVFLFFDRTFVLQNASVISLWDLGLQIFRNVIMNNAVVQSRTTKSILKLIESERDGNQVDRQLLKSMLGMMSSLGIYESAFEGEFLATTKALYESEGRQLCRDLEVSGYLRYVKRRLEEESARVDYYLDFGTRKPLIALTEKCLVIDHMESFVHRGVDVMLHENRCEDLSLLYKLLAHTKEGLTLLRSSFASYIKKVGKALVMDTDRDKTLVSDLLQMKKKLDNILECCFEKNEKFIQAEKDSFDVFINTRPNKPAELVAKYMDNRLRSGNRESTDEELENLMDEVIVIFRFIQGKDVFEAFFKKDLAKRLLLGRSASVDAEKSLLSKLKQECGAGFTTKLEGMFKDMEVSKDLGVAFKQYMEHGGEDRCMKHGSGNIDFTVSVLTMGHWPSYEPMEVAIPPDLAEYQEWFTKFYFSKHNGRKLQWQHSLAQFLLKARFAHNVVKELQVSMFQALILLLFNEKLTWTYEEIAEATKIEAGELERTLQSLACGKLRVIQKCPRGKKVNPGDVFTVNDECKEKLYRIRISQVQMKETALEHSQTEEQIFQDRQYQIDAAIVRIMKMRKTLAHQLLISELFNQLRFPVKPVDLKKRIESLIEREYMCRDSHDSNMYNYVA